MKSYLLKNTTVVEPKAEAQNPSATSPGRRFFAGFFPSGRSGPILFIGMDGHTD
jgi:hypothetical protein